MAIFNSYVKLPEGKFQLISELNFISSKFQEWILATIHFSDP